MLTLWSDSLSRYQQKVVKKRRADREREAEQEEEEERDRELGDGGDGRGSEVKMQGVVLLPALQESLKRVQQQADAQRGAEAAAPSFGQGPAPRLPPLPAKPQQSPFKAASAQVPQAFAQAEATTAVRDAGGLAELVSSGHAHAGGAVSGSLQQLPLTGTVGFAEQVGKPGLQKPSAPPPLPPPLQQQQQQQQPQQQQQQQQQQHHHHHHHQHHHHQERVSSPASLDADETDSPSRGASGREASSPGPVPASDAGQPANQPPHDGSTAGGGAASAITSS